MCSDQDFRLHVDLRRTVWGPIAGVGKESIVSSFQGIQVTETYRNPPFLWDIYPGKNNESMNLTLFSRPPVNLKTRQDIPFKRTYQVSGSPTRLDILIDVGDVHTVDGRNPAPARACLTPAPPVQCCVLKPCAPVQDFSHSTSLLLGHFFLPMLNGEHETASAFGGAWFFPSTALVKDAKVPAQMTWARSI